MERAYTAREIDTMREAVRDYSKLHGPYYEGLKLIVAVEEAVRTYMYGNAIPADVVSEYAEKVREFYRQQEADEAMWRDMMARSHA